MAERDPRAPRIRPVRTVNDLLPDYGGNVDVGASDVSYVDSDVGSALDGLDGRVVDVEARDPGHVVQDEGESLPEQPLLNFTGRGVHALDGDGATDVIVAGDVNSTKVAEQAPDDAVIWFPANAADIVVSPDAGDRQIILEATEDWEGTALQEATVWFEDGLFHMTYSGGWVPSGLGYATAEHPLGPWTKHPDNPIIGLGAGGESGNAKCSFHFIDDDGEHYTYYVHNYAGSGTEDLFVATGRPPNLTKVGVALEHTATADAIQNCCVVNDGGTYRMIFDSHVGSGAYWQAGYATADNPLGPFTVQQFPLDTLQVAADGIYGGPCLRRNVDNTGWVLLYHAAAVSGTVPNDIYRATSTDLLTWTQDPDGPLVERVVDPPENDQVADPHYLVCDFGAYLFWEGVNNSTETAALMVTQVIHGDPQWFDGDTWHLLWPAEGEVTQAELDAAVAALEAADDALADDITDLEADIAALPTSGELLMQDGVTAPPVPLETEAQDDWLYEG